MVLFRKTGIIEHRRFSEISNYIRPGDLLVLNNTKVLPARVIGRRAFGASVELLFLEELRGNCWKALIKSNAKLKSGEKIFFNNNLHSANLLKKELNGSWQVEFDRCIDMKEFLRQEGEMPLPPYIKRSKINNTYSSVDKERYQTVFAQKEGAVAAPTAGLHFTENTIRDIKGCGAEIEYITLHVGAGTFSPIKAEEIRHHHMQKEYYECPKGIIKKLQQTKKRKGRIIATGSTSCRVLETIAMDDISPQFSGFTDLFIYPPYNFKNVDMLITNFHLPKSTLLLLVSAFAGRENILNAYEEAKRKGYRFYSYGDCMMIC